MNQKEPLSAQVATLEEGIATARVGATRYPTEITLPGGHQFTVNDKKLMSGSARNPIDLLVAALASCKAVTLRGQADNLGFPMTGAVVTTKHQRVAARKLQEGAKGVVDVIESETIIEGDELTTEQRQRLHELSDRCWVQHALARECNMTSTLLEEPVSS